MQLSLYTFPIIWPLRVKSCLCATYSEFQAVDRWYVNRYYVEMCQVIADFNDSSQVDGEWLLTNVSWPISSSSEFYNFFGAYRDIRLWLDRFK